MTLSQQYILTESLWGLLRLDVPFIFFFNFDCRVLGLNSATGWNAIMFETESSLHSVSKSVCNPRLKSHFIERNQEVQNWWRGTENCSQSSKVKYLGLMRDFTQDQRYRVLPIKLPLRDNPRLWTGRIGGVSSNCHPLCSLVMDIIPRVYCRTLKL